MKETTKNITYNFLYRLVNMAVPLVTAPYLSRNLGASGVGIFSYLNSITYIFFSLAMLGVNTYGSREIAKAQHDFSKLSRTFWDIFYIQFFGGIIFTIIYFVLSITVLDSYGIISIIMGLYILSSLTDIDWFAFGMENFKLTSITRIISKLLIAVCIFLFVGGAGDLWKYALIIQLGNIVPLMLIWPYVKKNTTFCFPSKRILLHIKPDVVLFIPVIASSAYQYIDKIMLGSMASTAEVGYYNYAENIFSILCSLTIASSSVLLSRSSKFVASGQSERSIESVYKTSEILSILNIGIMFGSLALMGTFIPWYLGSEFSRTAVLINLLSPAIVITGLIEIIKNQVLIPNNMDKAYLISIIIGAIGDLLFNLLFIKYLGAVGAVIATMIAYLLTFIVQMYFSKAIINYGRIILHILPYVLIGVIMFFALNTIKISTSLIILDIVIKIVVGLIIYGGSSLGIFLIINNVKINKNKNN